MPIKTRNAFRNSPYKGGKNPILCNLFVWADYLDTVVGGLCAGCGEIWVLRVAHLTKCGEKWKTQTCGGNTPKKFRITPIGIWFWDETLNGNVTHFMNIDISSKEKISGISDVNAMMTIKLYILREIRVWFGSNSIVMLIRWRVPTYLMDFPIPSLYLFTWNLSLRRWTTTLATRGCRPI